MLEFKNEEKINEEIKKMTDITRMISAIRFILAAGVVVFVILAFSVDVIIYGSVAIGLFLVFLFFLLFTGKYFKKLELVKNKKEAIGLHKKRRQGLYHTFKDNGSDLLNKADYKEADLDLFGRHSLFQYLSSAKTAYGRQELKNVLVNGSDLDYSDLSFELAENECVTDFEASLMSFEGKTKNLDYEALYSTVGSKIKFDIKFLIPLLSFIGMLVFIPFAIIKGYNLWLLMIFFIANWLLCRICLNNTVFLLNSDVYYDVLENYQDFIQVVNNTDINNELYHEIKKTLNENEASLKSVKSMVNLLAYRKNSLFNIVSNMLVVFDLWIICIYNIKARKVNGLKEIFEAVGHFETALSLANIGMDNAVYTRGEENASISAIDMYHPLVKNCIPNSIEFKGGIILTGSNMSGKTTFMRTLGLCQVLYNAKGLIPAYVFQSERRTIHTSLRANDMLSEGVSTFYAEILRMKEISKAIKEEKCLILVDEIFKGTNATERIEASFKVIEKLNNYGAFFIISTHDFELCNAENILNYHFNEEYNEDKISFDYKIKEGRSATKNAIYLLKMADIIE